MKHVVALIAALALFAVGTVILKANLAALATAPLLLGAIVGLYLLALLLAIPAQMQAAGAQVLAWWRAYKNPAAAPDPAAPSAQREAAPEVDHAAE